MTKGYYEVQETRIIENNYFVLYRKRFQRKTGGCKNKWVISVKVLSLPEYAEMRNASLAIMKSYGGEDFGPRSSIFRRYKDAEKAWVYLMLRWS